MDLKTFGRFLALAVFGILVILIFNSTAITQEQHQQQQGKLVLTEEDYLRAEKFLSIHTDPLVY
jgi:branched-subunit amino acid transport protein AzlD